MRTIAKWTCITLGGLFLLGIIVSIASGPADKPASATPTPATAAATPTKTPAPAKPSARFKPLCAYLLEGDGKPYRFVASVQARNTGTTSITVRSVASWDQLGSAAVKQTRTFKVPAGASRTVQFTSSTTVDGISAHQAADAKCRVRSRIVAP